MNLYENTRRQVKTVKKVKECIYVDKEYVTKDKTLIDHKTVSTDQFLPANLDDPANGSVLPHPQQSGVLLDGPGRWERVLWFRKQTKKNMDSTDIEWKGYH